MSKMLLPEQRQQYQLNLARALRTIVAALARWPEVERALLFGSYARGRRDLFTDLDILIVMESSLDFVTRTAEMYRYLTSFADTPMGVDMDLLVYTPEELRQNSQRGFIRQVLAEGELIYERQPA